MTAHPLLRNHLPQRAKGGAGKKEQVVPERRWRSCCPTGTHLDGQRVSEQGAAHRHHCQQDPTAPNCALSQAEHFSGGCFTAGISSRWKSRAKSQRRQVFFLCLYHSEIPVEITYILDCVNIRFLPLVLLSDMYVICEISYRGEQKAWDWNPLQISGQHEGSSSCLNEV